MVYSFIHMAYRYQCLYCNIITMFLSTLIFIKFDNLYYGFTVDELKNMSEINRPKMLWNGIGNYC